MLNKIMIIGHLGKKPEIRYLDSGIALAKFSVASTEKYKNKAGEMIKATEWFNVEAWGRQAEISEKYLDKGCRVYIEGKQKTDVYKDKDGIEKRSVKLVCKNLTILDFKNKEELYDFLEKIN